MEEYPHVDGELLPRLLDRLCDVQTALPVLLAHVSPTAASAPSISESTVTLLGRGSHSALRDRLADGTPDTRTVLSSHYRI